MTVGRLQAPIATIKMTNLGLYMKAAALRLLNLSRQLSMSPIPPTTIAKHYDYLVIGGGSGGVASARRAASYGAKVLIVEAKFGKMGGTCVNVGCVPKKVMWYTADMAHKLEQMKSYGLTREEQHVTFGTFDWPAIKTKRDAYIKRLNGIYERNIRNEGADFVYGRAHFANSNGDVEVTILGDQELEFLGKGSDGLVKLGDKLLFSSEKVLIATGGAPIIPPKVEGLELGTTSDGFFELETQPEKVVVVGAGYIGVELLGIFASLGSETSLVIRGDTVLRNFDDMIQNTITDYYTDKLGVNVVKQSGSVTKVTGSKSGKKQVHLGNGQVLEADELIWTVGRHALIDIGLDKVGLTANDRGFVQVDEYQQTSNPKIFSLGDVIGKVDLTPVAIATGRKLLNRLFSGKEIFAQQKQDFENVPLAIFSHPEAGLIGLSTKDAIEKYGEDSVKVYKSSFVAMNCAMLDLPEMKSPTNYKIVCAGPDEKVVGLHMVGDASAEILQGFGVAVKMGATKADFDGCVAIHPTSAEELVTMT